MHIADQANGNLGANAIVGGSAGIATGAAFSAKYRKSGQVAVCFFGEGALGQGLLTLRIPHRDWMDVVLGFAILPAEHFAWLRAYCPVDSIGGSILLYYFNEPPITTDTPATPAASWSVSPHAPPTRAPASSRQPACRRCP